MLTYTYTNEAVLGLELLGRLQVIVDQGEAGGLSTTESSAETEAEDNLLIDLVHLGELLAKLILGDVSASGVDDIHDHLLTGQEAVGQELAGSDGSSGISLCVGDFTEVSPGSLRLHGLKGSESILNAHPVSHP